jgi:hypothetical protein
MLYIGVEFIVRDITKVSRRILASRVKVDFMGEADCYLGTHFDWDRYPEGNITCHMSQEEYSNMFVDAMGLQDAVSSPRITPYHFGLAIDTLSPHNMLSNSEREI